SLDLARRAHAQAQLRAIGTALEQYYFGEARYPETLQALRDPLPSGLPPLAQGTLEDPWGRPIRYEVTGGGYRLRSLGDDPADPSDDLVCRPGGAHPAHCGDRP